MAEFPGKFPWLRQTYGHPFKGVEFRVLISLFDHANGQTGLKSHPGLDLLVEETGYGKAAVSAAITALKAKGWIHETYRGNGRSGLSSEFALVPDAPNPDYRCSMDRCSTCSKGSPTGEALTQPKGSSLDETSHSNGSPFGPNRSPTDEPIVRLEANPIDPRLDPNRSGRGGLDPSRAPVEARSGLSTEGQREDRRSEERGPEGAATSGAQCGATRRPVVAEEVLPTIEEWQARNRGTDPWADPDSLPAAADDEPPRTYPNAVNPFGPRTT